MASYIDEILQPGERRVYSGRLHWILGAGGYLLWLVALIAFVFSLQQRAQNPTLEVLSLAIAAVAFVIGAAVVIRAWFHRWTTEIEVTDRRIVLKRGFINRNTIEMHMDKVESVDVDQSILGRILNYGDVTIRGVGVGLEPIKTVAAPLEFRNHVTGR